MAKPYQVLSMLIPGGGYIQYGEEYEGIQFIECEPITKEQYEEGFVKYDELRAQREAELAEAKTALLNKLGITAEEAKLLLA